MKEQDKTPEKQLNEVQLGKRKKKKEKRKEIKGIQIGKKEVKLCLFAET